ncbi:hypothetical protein BX666DRAFT_1879434 [Dichotomocladium elegans]|nr:hypothetical protein BX666DRAFT_1879434 [Dichotomocladium elegans]
MLSRKQGYDAIPTSGPENGSNTISDLPSGANHNNSADSLPGNDITTPRSRWQRAKKYVSKGLVRSRIGYILCGLIIFTLFIAFLLALFLPHGCDVLPLSGSLRPPVKIGVSEVAMEQGLKQCEAMKRTRLVNRPNAERKNPRAPADARPVLLKNANVWDGQGNILEGVDVLLQEGVIKQVEQVGIQSYPPSTKVIDVRGRIVSPGLVDMHSHLGLDAWPELNGSQETNEATDPLTPFVRSLDAFNPNDKAIPIVASGGVTTVLVLPGSANLMGGEAFVFKLRPVPTTSNADMLAQAGVDETLENKWRWMKMACGENPKKLFIAILWLEWEDADDPLSIGMGEAFLFRKKMNEAKRLKEMQEDWCHAAELMGENARLESRFPEDLGLEPLVALLRGDVLLNVHCYETHDLEAMIRLSKEFNFNITAFHHALDAYLVPDMIKGAHNNITIATFADHWGYKKEAFQASPYSPKILYEAGLPVALKSDHPVLNSQHLVFEAAKASHYGLPAQEAFKAVTSVPASAIGLGHRIGSLKVGYDADVVIWDRPPLTMGAAPLQVFIDGVPLLEEKPILPPIAAANENAGRMKMATADEVKLPTDASTVVFENVGGVMYDETFMAGPVQVIVHQGDVICAGEECDVQVLLSVAATEEQQVPTIDVKGGYMIPGLIAVGSRLGMVEIPSEKSTGDGTVQPSTSLNASTLVYAIDGLKLGTRHLEEAYKGGVLTSITAPMSNGVIAGVSAAFKTGADSVLSDGAVINPNVALHLQVGDDIKSESFPTVSSQISFIRQVLTENMDAKNAFGQAARGDIPIIISVHNKDEIASLILLKKKHLPHARMAIMGGAESHLLAEHLAEADIAVILRPALCTPARFDSIHCLTGAPLTNGTAAHILHKHGVKIAIGVEDDGLARNLAWDAGWLAATSSDEGDGRRMSEMEAIRLVTTNIVDIFGLGRTSSSSPLVLWSGSPFEMRSRPLYSYDKGWNAL